ncbi:YfbU family protein [Roseibacillus persicicus]|uniref:YfbU family protein n=1 Tax=Roseibacillus persicicus TaxID=454148 RepID=UPI00398B1C19
MDITNTEKLILINQYKILAKLDPDSSSYYEKAENILSNGYRFLYGSLDNWIDDEMSEDKSEFVMDILSLYRAIGHIDDTDDQLGGYSNRVFRGFDGNEEGEYFSFTRFVIEEEGKFAEQKGGEASVDGYNSHCPMVPTYAAMIQRWESRGKKYQLTLEEIKAILGE